ncbi:MAG: divalent-cation tolerance protein CutA [Pirellulales bacterium]|nr:divalent-cation tolerance protein CutA [Pirellulales bacterium]
MSDFIQVLTTVGEQDESRRIADALIEQRLAACVHLVGPIESVYRWNGTIETAVEWQCWIKTRRELFEAVEAVIRKLHSYNVPEILVLPVIAGSAPYLKWLADETAS